MKRRNFLSLLSAAGAAPLLTAPSLAAPVSAGYNRYMYGLAVFHARTRASISAVDIASRLKVSAATADAMIGEMARKGVLAPALNAAAGTMRAISPTGQTRPPLARMTDDAVQRFLTPDDAKEPVPGSPERTETTALQAEQMADSDPVSSNS